MQVARAQRLDQVAIAASVRASEHRSFAHPKLDLLASFQHAREGLECEVKRADELPDRLALH
jgi:hypothetical protein